MSIWKLVIWTTICLLVGFICIILLTDSRQFKGVGAGFELDENQEFFIESGEKSELLTAVSAQEFVIRCEGLKIPIFSQQGLPPLGWQHKTYHETQVTEVPTNTWCYPAQGYEIFVGIASSVNEVTITIELQKAAKGWTVLITWIVTILIWGYVVWLQKPKKESSVRNAGNPRRPVSK